MPKITELIIPIGAIILFFIKCVITGPTPLPASDTDSSKELNSTTSFTNVNGSTTSNGLKNFKEQRGVAWRTLIVCVCLTVFVLIYFGVRAIR